MTEQMVKQTDTQQKGLKLPGRIRELHLEPCAAWVHHLRQVEKRAGKNHELVPEKLKRVLDEIWEKAVEASRDNLC